MNRRLFIHVGASKTGTSALQRGLWRSVAPLLDAGVGLPLVGRPAHVRQLLRPLGWVASEGYVQDVRRRPLARMRRVLRDAPGESLLLSNEDLAELDEDRVARVHALAERAGLEVSVIITTRTWARQVPSEYQQFLKHRLTTDYRTWLEQVRERRGPSAEHFWLRQDFAAMARRWARHVPADRIHVVSSPARPLTAGTELFCEILGVPPGVVDVPTASVNASFGIVEAEVYRRLNQSLPSLFDDYEGSYYPGVRIPVVSGVLPREASSRLSLPPDHLPWVVEESSRQRDELGRAGYAVHGDLDLLVPDGSAAAELAEVDEAEVAAAAVAALGRMMARAHRERRQEG